MSDVNKNYIFGDWHGVPYRLTGPVKEGPNYRVSILINPLNKGRAMINIKKRDKDPDRAVELAREEAEKKILEHRDEFLELIKSGEYRGTMDLYFALRKEEILYYADHDLEPEAYCELWERPAVQEKLGTWPISEPLTEKKLDKLMTAIFGKKTRKKRITDDEKRLWALLSDICSRAVLDGLLEELPRWEKAKKHKKSLIAKALERLSRYHFSVQEFVHFLKLCFEAVEAGSEVHAAILVCTLTGISCPQICALDRADWKRREQPAVSWLEVTKELHQDRKYPPRWKKEFDTPFGYHRVVCTDLVEHILYKVCIRHENSQAAMFTVDGFRLEPNIFRKALNELLDQVIEHGGRVGVRSRNRMGRDDDRQITNGDFLRANYEYYMRTYCGMQYAAFAAYMGRVPDDTYAKSYVDWHNPYVMYMFRLKEEKWHHALLQVMNEDDVERVVLPGSYLDLAYRLWD